MSPPIHILTRNESGIRDWFPPAIRRWGNRMLGASIIFRGPFSDWASASASTAGYDQHVILERVSRAICCVLDGSAVFEQDGLALHHAPPPSHALDGLLLAAALDGGRLSVLDFGGGLASHYLRWRSLLSALPDVRWAVVEQANYVAEGRRLFSTNPVVSFHEDIATSPHPRTWRSLPASCNISRSPTWPCGISSDWHHA